MPKHITNLTFRVRTFPRQRERWAKFYAKQWETTGTATATVEDLKPSTNLAALDAERRAEREEQLKEKKSRLLAKPTMQQLDDAKRSLKLQSKLDAMVGYLNAAKIDIRNLPDWRWLDGINGEVNGLPTSRGRAMMTDGVIVLIERDDGTVLRAHYQWFIEDSILSEASNPSPHKPRKARVVDPKIVAQAEALFKLLQA